jgi:hypothetical protein
MGQLTDPGDVDGGPRPTMDLVTIEVTARA